LSALKSASKAIKILLKEIQKEKKSLNSKTTSAFFWKITDAKFIVSGPNPAAIFPSTSPALKITKK